MHSLHWSHFSCSSTTWAQGAVNPDSNGERYHKLTWASQMGEPAYIAFQDPFLMHSLHWSHFSCSSGVFSSTEKLGTWYGIKGLMWDYDENGNIYFTELGQMCANAPSYDLTQWSPCRTGYLPRR
mgnify:CR=1 FL=1